MSTQTKLFMTPYGRSWRTQEAVEITDEQDAVGKCINSGAIAFTTHEVSIAVVDGEELRGKPRNLSPRRFVGIDKIYSPQDRIAYDENTLQKERDDIMRKILIDFIEAHKKASPDRAYIIDVTSHPGDFIELKPDEKAFGKDGQQLWPKPQQPAITPPPPKPPGFS
ncbi:MAG: hypothetical protein H6867_03530 [Rhodospirillales bacterium]|nr:hypothetical protein [Rhodospirillales bacterium]MCB9996223.1 hypothetical protein [Rhodospirillales bacterium]